MEANSITKHREAGGSERPSVELKMDFLIATDFRANKHCIVCVYQQNIDFVPRSNNNIHENCKKQAKQ